MRVSLTGALIGAGVGAMARGMVVLLNLGGGGHAIGALAIPSMGIGLLVGAIAGATGNLLIGAIVGGILSGLVFELFMCACASLVGTFQAQAGADFLAQTIVYGLEMAAAGAVAGGIGGAIGANEFRRLEEPQAAAPAEDETVG